MSPEYETLIYEKKGMVALITLNRPERMNAINVQMNADLKDSLKKIYQHFTGILKELFFHLLLKQL